MSSKAELSELEAAVLEAVDAIPEGQVRSYGDIADELGCSPRQVGRIMALFGASSNWWRVVRADGTSAVAERAKAYWAKEGIAHTERGVSPKMLRRP